MKKPKLNQQKVLRVINSTSCPWSHFKKLEDVKTEYRIANSAALLEQLVAELKTAGTYAFDTETTSLNPRSARLVGISFSIKAHSGWFVPIPDDTEAAQIYPRDPSPYFQRRSPHQDRAQSKV